MATNTIPAATSASGVVLTLKGERYVSEHNRQALIRQEASEIIEGCLDLVERMLRVLDRLEPDPDLEPNGDELDVSWPEGCRPFDTSLSEDDEDSEVTEDDDPAEDDDHAEADGDDEANVQPLTLNREDRP